MICAKSRRSFDAPIDTGGTYIPKMHGTMKMIEFKYFVKAPWDLTRRRVSEFAKQVANRVFETLTFEVAHEGVARLEKIKVADQYKSG